MFEPSPSSIPAGIARIIVLNSLDDRYGSTYRLRALTDLLSAEFETSFMQSGGSPLRKLFLALRASCSDYDLLFTQKFNPVTLPAIWIARIRGKPVLVDWDDFDTGLQKSWILRLLTGLAERIGPRFATVITTHSRPIQILAEEMGRPTFYVPQGYSSRELWFDPMLQEPARVERGFTPSDFVVGHLCTFTHGGTLDLSTILEAWSRITDPSIRFLLIGGGPLEKEIRRELDRRDLTARVSITGLLDREGVRRALHALDLGVVMMSDTEANRARISFKTLEYLALGLPVAGKVVGETDRLFGHLVSGCEESGLPDTILKLCRERKRPGAASSVSEYEWARIGPGLFEAVRCALKGADLCL